MCLCYKVIVKWDSGYLKLKVFLIMILDYRIGMVVREVYFNKKKKKFFGIDLFYDEFSVGKRLKVKRIIYFFWIKIN